MNCICIVHNYTEETFAGMSFHLANYLAKNGFNVLFISHKPQFNNPVKISDYSGFIHVYSWPYGRRPTGLRSFLWFSRLYIKYKPDKVIAHFVGSNIAALVSKILSFWHARTYVYYHTLSTQNIIDSKNGTVKHRLLLLRKKIYYNLFCDNIICPSNLAGKDFNKLFENKKGRLVNSKCRVILNPLVDRYIDGNFPGNENTEKISISYLGRLDPSKGINILISAFIKYQKEKQSKIILHFAGSGFLAEQIMASAKGHPNIIFEGHKKYSEVDEYIKGSDFIIIPSLSDNLPTVGIESLMNGVPLLLSTKTGLAEYLTDGVEGYLFAPSEQEIMNVFERVEKNISSHFNLSNNARKTYCDKFTIDRYCATMSKLLE